jgi:hypothetical protein
MAKANLEPHIERAHTGILQWADTINQANVGLKSKDAPVPLLTGELNSSWTDIQS